MSVGTQVQPGGASNRKLRNFLLDARFQLKFAAYFVVLALVVAALLGVFLVRTTDSLFSQLVDSAEARKKAAETSRELGQCTVNNDLRSAMGDPSLFTALTEKSKSIDAAYEAEKKAAAEAALEVQRQQDRTLWALLGVLLAFIVLIALVAIVITHRIVGPLFRIKRMAREVAQGTVRPPTYGLRPGDELQDVFAVFSEMVTALRARTEDDLAAVRSAEPGALKKLEGSLEERLSR